jgi:hypothetical protein
MPGIKFNQVTKKIDVKDSESFIESNLNKIQDLLVERFGVKKIWHQEKQRQIRDPYRL